MAIPFYIPEGDDIEVVSPNASSSSQASSSSVPQTPATPLSQYSPQSDNDYLVQAFCTALHRYSRGGN